MLKRMFSAIALTLILSALIVVSEIQPGEAVTVFYIRPDGSIWPLEANKYIVRVEDVFYYFFRDASNPVVIQRSNIVLDGDGYTLQGSGTGSGLLVEDQSNVTIRNTMIRDWKFGIYLESCSGIQIIENQIETCRNSSVHFYWCDYNMISGNNITGGYWNGVEIYESHDNTITGNDIANNTRYGLLLSDWCFNTHVSGNNVVGNKFGIGLGDADNRIYHNNFIMNDWEYVIRDDTHNRWICSDFHHEGNYWSDYEDRYPFAAADEFGIWNIGYFMNPGNIDHFPLVNVYWNPGDINHDLKVDMKDVAAAAKAYGSFPGFPNWNCHADIAGPTPLEPDCQVDMRDVALIAKYYGEMY